jgi:hypothetical protein
MSQKQYFASIDDSEQESQSELSSPIERAKAVAL